MAHADHPEKHRTILPVVLVLLPVIYLTAFAPLKWLYRQGAISPTVAELLNEVYSPLRWIEKDTDFFEHPPGSAYVWYIELFEP